MINLAEYRRLSQSLADFLPWAALVREGVVLNKDGSFQRTAKFRGPDLDSSTSAELVAITSRLNNALRRLGTGWAIFIEAQRSQQLHQGDDLIILHQIFARAKGTIFGHAINAAQVAMIGKTDAQIMDAPPETV